MDEILLKNKLTNIKGKLNGNYNKMLSDSEKEFIMTLYPLYSELSDCCHALVNGGYNKCENCEVVFIYGKKTYIKTCSNTCRNIIRKAKREQTNLERYGFTNPSKNELVKEKIEQTNLERYGVKYLAQNKEIKEKMEQTNLERYGFTNPTKNEDVINKRRNTNLERYGNINILNSDSVLNKKYLERKEYIYNITGIELNKEEIDKLKINEKIHNYSESFIKSLVCSDNLSFEDINNQFKSTYTRYSRYKDNGIEIINNKSTMEKQLCDFLDSESIKYITSDRKQIAPYELDIYIPEHNLAIEFNGTYWHSDIFKDKHYHQNKTVMCNEKGITLIHIYEHIYDDKQHVYESILRSKLNLNKRIYARKCELKEVPKQEEKDFLNNYHLQGFVGSSKCYGLYFNDELITLCSFGKSRFNKNYNYELLRNCTKPYITVVGGFSKMIKHYKNEIENQSILCYNDASISYNKNNKLTDPNYVWVKNGRVLKRYNTMKHKLKDLLGDGYNNKNSESENMVSNGYYRLFDSGNYKIIY